MCWKHMILAQSTKIDKIIQKIPECLFPQGSIVMQGMYTRAQNVCPGWPVYEVKQPQEKWACDFHDDAPPLSFQLQVAEVIF